MGYAGRRLDRVRALDVPGESRAMPTRDLLQLAAQGIAPVPCLDLHLHLADLPV